MPIFEIEGPDGVYEVDAPDPQTAAAAFKKMQGSVSQESPQPSLRPNGIFDALTGGSEAGLMGGYDDEIGAGMMAPIHAGMDWFKGEGFNLGKAYSRLQEQLDTQKDQRREAHPVASIGGELAGAATLASRVPSIAGRALPVLGRTGAAMLEAAGYGGLYGSGEAEPGERLAGAGKGAAIGLIAGGTLERAGRGISSLLSRRAAPSAPTTQDLASEANALYAQARDAGITVKAPAVDKLAANVQLAAGRLNKDLRPNTAGIVDDVISLKGKNVSLEELDELRQVVNQSMARAQPQDIRTLERIKTVIDDFAENAKPSDIVGDIKGFGYIKQARDVWSKKAKSQILDDLVEKAQNQATGFENGIVIQMRSLANNPKRLKAFSKEEQKLIKDVVRRGTPHGVLRALGMLSPNSTFGGLMTGGVGVGAGILPGAALAGTGMAARAGAGALTRGKMDTLRRAVATGQIPSPAQLPPYLRPLIPGGVAASTEVPLLLEGSRGR